MIVDSIVNSHMITAVTHCVSSNLYTNLCTAYCSGLCFVQKFSEIVNKAVVLQYESSYVMLMQVVVSMRNHGYLVSQMMRVMMRVMMIMAVRITVVDTGRKIIRSQQIMHHLDSHQIRMVLVVLVHPVILVPVNDRLCVS